MANHDNSIWQAMWLKVDFLIITRGRLPDARDTHYSVVRFPFCFLLRAPCFDLMSGDRPSEWLENLRRGDEDSARRIFEHYSQKLCRLAQSHLSSRVRQRADGEDVVQSVFRTFFQRDSEGKFTVDHSDELWRLLVTITVRKARGIWRKNSGAGRSVDREVPLDENTSGLATAFSQEPSVVEALVLADEIETALVGLSEASAQALELRMGGYSPTEAAELMGVSRQAFYRLLDPIKQRLLQRGQSPPGTSAEQDLLPGSSGT